jgi:hypothetical protein
MRERKFEIDKQTSFQKNERVYSELEFEYVGKVNSLLDYKNLLHF